MKGTVWQRCTKCRRKVNGRDATRKHKASGCDGSNATWAFKADVGVRDNGKRRQLVRGGFDTQADADRALRELLGKHDRGRHVEDTGLTLGGFLLDEWAPAMKAGVAPSTYTKRARHMRYVIPRIGSLPLMRVTAGDLERLYAELLEDGGAQAQGLAPSSVRDVHRTLHKAFVDAMRWQRTDRNPAAAAEAPKVSAVDASARAVRQAWTGEELGRFLDATADHRLAVVFALAAYTGARRSELLALTWSDVDLDGQRLRIDKALVKQEDGSFAVRDSTKSSASARTINLDDDTVALLRRHRAAQAAQRLRAGSAWVGRDTLLTDELGAMLSPEAVSQAFRRANDRLEELPRIRLHDLRHTHATILLQSGVPVRTVSQRLGHRSPMVTMTIYSHVMPGDDRAAADRFASLVQRKDVL